VRGLAQKLAGVGIENPLVRGGTVAPHQHPPGGQRVAQRNVAQFTVAALARRIKNDADVHHGVDEQRIVGDEGAQIRALFLEARCERAAGFDQNVAQSRLMRQPVPPVVCGQKQKPEIVPVAVVLAGLDRRGVLDRILEPVFRFGRIRSGVFVEHPHHSREKTVGPVRPHLAFMFPEAVLRMQRVQHRVFFNQFPHLFLREMEGLAEQFPGVGC